MNRLVLRRKERVQKEGKQGANGTGFPESISQGNSQGAITKVLILGEIAFRLWLVPGQFSSFRSLLICPVLHRNVKSLVHPRPLFAQVTTSIEVQGQFCVHFQVLST